MGLDWHIKINGKTADQRENLRCNGMVIDHYLDGTTAAMVADLGLNPYYPLWPSAMSPSYGYPCTKTEIDAEDMTVIAQIIAKKAECAEHMRIAAWLWSWANCDEKDYRITLYMSY